MNVMREQKGDKIIQYGERVWGITEGSRDERIDRTIAATEEFFRSLGLATRLSENNIDKEVAEQVVLRFKERGTLLGENENIDYLTVEKILSQRL
jgi:NADP-dependent alcohol dehydrogenase